MSNTVKEYEQKAREFKGEKFNAQDYVDLALKAKMKYITSLQNIMMVTPMGY